MRISLDDKLYWQLVRIAADQEMRYYDLLESWIRDAWDHRDDLAKNPDKPPCQASCLPPDSKRPKGTFSEAEIDQIRALHAEGLSPGKIAKELHRHKSSVAYAVDKMKKRGEL